MFVPQSASQPIDGSSTFRRVFWAIAGALPLLTAHWWYKIGLLASAQVGTTRALALLGALGLGFLAVALIGAAACVWLRWDRAPELLRRGVRLAFVAGAAANLASVGLSLYHWSPMLAPIAWKLGALAGLMVFLVAYLRYGQTEQRLVARSLTGLGVALMLVPAIATPWMVHGATRFGAHLAHAPTLPAAPRPAPGAPERIVLVTFDALPAWVTSMHHERDLTPALAGLAREATWFSNARSAGASTLVSMPTILSGMPPRVLQPAVDNRTGFMPVNGGLGLAGYLKQIGYRGLYSTMIIEPGAFGMAGEFETGFKSMWAFFAREFQSPHYVPLREAAEYMRRSLLPPPPAPTTKGPAIAPDDYPMAVVATFERAMAMLEASSGPTFLWVHIGAPHLPYFDIPRRTTDAPPDTRRYRKVLAREAIALNAAPDVERTREIRSIYENYVHFVDGEFERFVDGLKHSSAWDATMVVVTADHGESVDPGFIGHSNPHLNSDLDHVPLIVRAPGTRQPGRVEAPVGHEDLVPTILAQAYAEPPTGFSGRNVLDAPVPDDRVVFTVGRLTEPGLQQRHPLVLAAYQGPFTYVIDFESGREQLFDRRRDPRERHDVARAHPEHVLRLRKAATQERARYLSAR